MKLNLIVALLLLLIPTKAMSEESLSQKDTDEIVKKFQTDYAATFDKRDAASMVSLFTETATMQNEWGDVTQGRSEIESLVKRLMTKLPAGAKLEDTALVSQCVAPNVIVSQGVSRRVVPDAETQQMFFTRVIVKRGDKWLLSATQIARPSSVPKPVPALPAAPH